jgi:hypothetical protein
MECITAYKANDGTLFLSEEEAIGHDIKNNLEERCDIFFDGFLNMGGDYTRGDVHMIITQWEEYLAKTSPFNLNPTETLSQLLVQHGDAWLVQAMMQLDVDPALVANALPEEIVLATAESMKGGN